jgi:hypothetical protein
MYVSVKMKSGKSELDATLPVTREKLDEMRAVWRDWLSQNPVNSPSSPQANDATAARHVVGIDKLNVSGFDKIVLGLAVVAKKIQYT